MNYLIFIIVALEINTSDPTINSQLLPERYTTPTECDKEAMDILHRMNKMVTNGAVVVKCLKAEDVEV